MSKKIELYTFTYNDEKFLPFFLDYYSWVDKMTFIDSSSTDNTLRLIKDHNVIQTGLTWWDWDKLFLYRNNIWRKSKYDLMINTDLDEILYRPNIKEFLESTDYDIYQCEGFQMISALFPDPGTNILEIKTGHPLPLHNKCAIYKPDINLLWNDSHYIITTSSNISRFEIKLLHYKWLGAKYMAERAKTIKERVPVDSYTEKINGNILKLFPEFVKTENEFRREIVQLLKKSTNII